MNTIQIAAALAAAGLLLYVSADFLRTRKLWPRAARTKTKTETPASTPPAKLYVAWREMVAAIEGNGYDAQTLPVAEIPKALAYKKRSEKNDH